MTELNEELKEAIRVLRKAASNVVLKAEQLKVSTNIVEVCDFYKLIHESNELLNEQMELIAGTKKDLSYEILPGLFEANQIDSIKVKGKNIIHVASIHASLPEEQRLKGLNWLRSNGYGMVIKEGVNAQTLTAAVKSYIKEKGEMPPKEIFSVHMRGHITMRKAT